MTTKLVWDNLVTYSLQIGLLVALASFLPAVLRLRVPGAKLAYWQILLGACLLLPVVRPWRQAVVASNVEITTSSFVIVPAAQPWGHHYSVTEIGLALLIAGAVLRLGWLGIGLWRLRRYRRHARPVELGGRAAGVPVFISDDVASPVTFGWRRPVILLPGQFPDLHRPMQEAVLCHELLHIERNDWLFILGEEIVRAVFWFHPAIWWLLGEIQLSREQAVDRGVVERTSAREEYVDALLAIAGAGAHPDLAPAPLFLRKRHLKHRVVSILKEVRMSKTRWISALAASLGFLMAACWFVTTTFPLAAAPQVVNDFPGVTVDLAGAQLLHRGGVDYPAAARKAHVGGTVSVELKLDTSGNVTDARVLNGPDELRKAVISSVLDWHFAASSAGATRVINVSFVPPSEEVPEGVRRGVAGGVTGGIVGGVPGGVKGAEPRVVQRREVPSASSGPVIKAINVVGLSDTAKAELLAKLPVHEGDTMTLDLVKQTQQAVKEFDEHLTTTMGLTQAGDNALTIATPNAAPNAGMRIKIGGNVQQSKLIRQPRPVYPPDAKAARVQGVVHLSAVIAQDGTMKSLEVLSGDPLLVPSALEAVRQWVYEPTFLNGNPVEVQTTIDVNYTLSQ